jgi:hypothetical protein
LVFYFAIDTAHEHILKLQHAIAIRNKKAPEVEMGQIDKARNGVGKKGEGRVGQGRVG